MGLVLGTETASNTKVVVENKMAKALTGAKFGDEEVLTLALPSVVGDVNDNVSKAGFGPVDWVSSGTKMLVNGKVVESLTGAAVDYVKDVVTVWGTKR